MLIQLRTPTEPSSPAVYWIILGFFLWLLQSLVSTFLVQVVETENMYIGSLAFGVTSCDPATVAVSSLPEDADMLLDRWTHT